ncbi:MAG: hypothetical protein HRT74_10520 [Flavobacteriales bacterium]|nr:hypothetical protein [Flavobacteriales bacterium]
MNQDNKWRSFIQENKDDFELETPSDGVWDRIEDALPEESKTKVISLKWFIGAAAACLMVGLFAGTWFAQNRGANEGAIAIANQEQTSTEPTPEAKVTFGALSEDLKEVETFYISEVSDKLTTVNQYDVDEEWLLEIEILNDDFEGLKQALSEGADREKIVEAMIQNYRYRLELLELLLMEIEEADIPKKVEV